jgi:hypothetical protein
MFDVGSGFGPTASGGGGGGGPAEGILFAADFNDPGDNFGFAGGGADPDGAEASRWDRTHQATDGPDGEGCVEYEYFPVSIATINAETGNGQYYTRYATTSFTSIDQGENLYLRIYVKPLTFTNPDVWESNLEGGVSDDAWNMKFAILDGEPTDNERIIIHFLYDDFPATTMGFVIGLNIENPPNRTDGLILTMNQWNAVQFKIKTSSTTDATDGYFAGWVNADNDDENTPTEETLHDLVINVPAAGWTSSSFNDFQNQTLCNTADPTPSVSYQIAAWEIGTEFDENWFVNMTG